MSEKRQIEKMKNQKINAIGPHQSLNAKTSFK